MKIQPFKVEEWMNAYEDSAIYNIAETCVDPLSIRELFELTATDIEDFTERIFERPLTYGAITGSHSFKIGICKLYRSLKPDNILLTHGAAGANHLVFYALTEPGDHVISVKPTYQQLYSIPESFGAEVQILKLRRESNYLPDLAELKEMIRPDTKLICLNNPNNPTGALIPNEMLRKVVEMAENVGAYVLCDEVYRGLNQNHEYTESVADLYERGISVGSMSKIFSLSGLRLGWIATHNQEVIKACFSHRDYSLISCGILDEAVASEALKNGSAVFNRNLTRIRENLAILDSWIREQPHVSYIKPRAGTTALIHYDFDIPSYDFCKQLLDKTGVFLTPGACFDEEYCFRIGYACATQTLKDGLQKLTEFTGGLSKNDAIS